MNIGNNKTVFIVDSFGEIMSEVSGTDEFIAANTQANTLSVEKEKPAGFCYWDSIQNDWIEPEAKPSSHHYFDYSTRKWRDPRNLTQLKDEKWSQLKQHRNALEFGGFAFEGNRYDSDQISQGRILGAVLAGQDQTWTTKDNSVVNLTATQLQELYVALQTHVAFAHERGRIARTALESATTKDEIDAIQL